MQGRGVPSVYPSVVFYPVGGSESSPWGRRDMGGFVDWIRGMLPAADPVDKELDEQIEKHSVKVKDIPPDVRADIDEETEEAIKDGRLIVGPATVTSTPLRKRTPAMTQALVDKINADLAHPPPETEEGYPVGDPKGVCPPDWDADPQPNESPLTAEQLEAAKKLMEMTDALPTPIPSQLLGMIPEMVKASQSEEQENRRKEASGEGGRDNRAFLALVNAFLRPEVALRKMPPEAREYRASNTFIRKIIELLRDVFPNVRDKCWVMQEMKDVKSNNIIVNVLVRVKEKPERDILIQIRPSHSRCLVRAEDDEPMLEDTTLDNARWDDFVGWVSLAKSLAEVA